MIVECDVVGLRKQEVFVVQVVVVGVFEKVGWSVFEWLEWVEDVCQFFEYFVVIGDIVQCSCE